MIMQALWEAVRVHARTAMGPASGSYALPARQQHAPGPFLALWNVDV